MDTQRNSLAEVRIVLTLVQSIQVLVKYLCITLFIHISCIYFIYIIYHSEIMEWYKYLLLNKSGRSLL